MQRLQRPIIKSGYVSNPEELQAILSSIKPDDRPHVEVASTFFENVDSVKKGMIQSHLQGCLDTHFTPWVVVRA